MIPKFRAWHKGREEFIPIHEIQIGGFREITGIVSCNFSYRNEEDVIIEQSTGLNDKNGKDIFEGDIVEYPKKYRTVIEWDDNLAMFIFKKPAHCYREECVVIGNIHENKELVKEVKNW